MLISVLIPIYNEGENLPLLYDQLIAELEKLDAGFEVIFINDGSSDASEGTLDQLAQKDKRIRVVHMRRNYGQTAAIMAGIQNATGDILIPMDGDMQNDPVDIQRLLDKLDEGYDVVSGWRKDRKDKAVTRRLPSIIANKLISKLLGVELHDYGCSLKAYRREVIEDVRLYGEMHRFIPIYAAWEGAKVAEIPVTHHPRLHGVSKYGLDRVLRVVLDIMLLYFFDRALDRPIQFFGKIGVYSGLLSLVSFLVAVGLRLYDKDNYSLIQTPLPLLAATLGLSGILFVLLGILAEIQSRTYFETRGRMPFTIKTVRNPGPADPD